MALLVHLLKTLNEVDVGQISLFANTCVYCNNAVPVAELLQREKSTEGSELKNKSAQCMINRKVINEVSRMPDCYRFQQDT